MKNAHDTAIVLAALDATPEDYLAKCCALRGCKTPEGSRYPLFAAEELPAALRAARWEAVEHPAVRAPARAYRTPDLRGVVGVVALDALPSRLPVTLLDSKGVGAVSAVIERRSAVLTLAAQPGPDSALALVADTWLIVGPHGGDTVVFTFHPGEPIAPSAVPADPHLVGACVTVERALALGLTHAKLAG